MQIGQNPAQLPEHFSIKIKDKEYNNLDLHQVKEGVSLEEAQAVLEAQKDGLDTLGVEIDGEKYLITGKGIQADVLDAVEIEGQAAGKVAFVEQENNTFSEGFQAARPYTLGTAVIAGPLTGIGALVSGAVAEARGATANPKVVQTITDGVVTPKLLNDLIRAMDALMGRGDD